MVRSTPYTCGVGLLTRCTTSLALGFVLSILGAALLFLGQLGSFASESLLCFVWGEGLNAVGCSLVCSRDGDFVDRNGLPHWRESRFFYAIRVRVCSPTLCCVLVCQAAQIGASFKLELYVGLI